MAQQQASHSGYKLGSVLDRITSFFADAELPEEAEAEIKQYSQLHSEYEDYQQEEMPELAETEQRISFDKTNTLHLEELLTTSFITNIKVQTETPTLQLCSGNRVRKDTVIDNNGQQKTIVHKPFKSCGSRSLSDKEREFAYPSPTSYMSYMAYDTTCGINVVDILYDLQDPITSLTPWIFGKIGETVNYFITAADKTGDCNQIYLTAPDCAAATLVNRVTLSADNPSNQQP